MKGIKLRHHYAFNILLRMILLAAVGGAILAWKFEFINDVYFRNQLTPTGLIINGTILALFGLGILKMIAILIGYVREERAIHTFVGNLEREADDLLERIPERAIIARRYQTMKRLHEAHTPINHNALASTLVASESTHNSFPKFINNILILTGVFGTIVSLSIALIGASDMLESSVDVGGMGLIMHGMSTALSTTITAIICYIYFGYFFLKLLDVQTNVVGAVEQVTISFLIPRFQVQTDSILYEFSGLVRSLQGLVRQIEQSQKTFEQIDKHLINTLDTYRDKIENVSGDMGALKDLLKRGFRLQDQGDD